MPGSLNKMMIIGNVGADPQIRTFPDGGRVANLTVATSESWRDKNTGEKREVTDWHRVAIFGPLVDVVEKWVVKGDSLYLEGASKTRKWQDQSGQDRYSTELVLRPFNGTLQMLGGKRSGDGASDGGGGAADSGARGHTSGGRSGAAGGGQFPPADMDDEIPF